MKLMLGRFLVLVMVLVGVSAGISRPRYIECLSSAECPVGHCCVLGMNKFSMPSCQPLGLHESVCRPRGEARNTSLTYPNGDVVDFIDVHEVLCPCAPGFQCDISTATCTDNFNIFYNHLTEDFDNSI